MSCAVAVDVGALQVLEQPAALAHQHQQPAARVVVLAVLAQVLGELVDARREQGDLDLGGPGVVLVAAVLADDLLLCLDGEAHRRETVAARSADLPRLLDVRPHLLHQRLDATRIAALPASARGRRSAASRP